MYWAALVNREVAIAKSLMRLRQPAPVKVSEPSFPKSQIMDDVWLDTTLIYLSFRFADLFHLQQMCCSLFAHMAKILKYPSLENIS